MSTATPLSTSARISRHIRTRLVSGLFVIIPLAVTFFVLNLFFTSFTVFVRPFLKPWLGDLPAYILTIIAFATTVLAVYLVGVIATHIIGRRFIQWGEKLLMKLPVVKTVYAASKQVVETFSSTKDTTFQAVVLIEYPRKGCYALGFVTGITRMPNVPPCYRVFVATTPNPTSGFLLLLPDSDVLFTDLSIEEGIKMIVSGGMLAPETHNTRMVPIQSNSDRVRLADGVMPS